MSSRAKPSLFVCSILSSMCWLSSVVVCANTRASPAYTEKLCVVFPRLQLFYASSGEVPTHTLLTPITRTYQPHSMPFLSLKIMFAQRVIYPQIYINNCDTCSTVNEHLSAYCSVNGQTCHVSDCACLVYVSNYSAYCLPAFVSASSPRNFGEMKDKIGPNQDMFIENKHNHMPLSLHITHLISNSLL